DRRCAITDKLPVNRGIEFYMLQRNIDCAKVRRRKRSALRVTRRKIETHAKTIAASLHSAVPLTARARGRSVRDKEREKQAKGGDHAVTTLNRRRYSAGGMPKRRSNARRNVSSLV